MVKYPHSKRFDGDAVVAAGAAAETFCPAEQFKNSGVYHHLADADHPAICDFIPGYAFYCFIGRKLAEQLISVFD